MRVGWRAALMAIAVAGVAVVARAEPAPASVCAAKFADLKTGAGQDVQADLDWLETYCGGSVKDEALNFIGAATMEAALSDTRGASAAAAAQAGGDIAAADAAANEASNQAMAGLLQAPVPTVVVAPTRTIIVAPPPRAFPPP